MIGSSADWKLTTTAYAHQRAAIEKLSRLRVGALFMDMGTGKTRTALELVWLRRKRITKCVWCCPVSLMEETKREILRHTSCIDTDIHMIGPRTREKNVPQTWWHIVGLESLSSSPRVVYVLDRLIDGGTFLVVDESTYIKGHRAKRTRRLIRFGTRTSYRLILTGTPIQQGIEDLYTQMEFLSPLILGYTSRHAFQSALAVFQTQKRAFSVESMSLGEVCRIIAPYVYQVSKEDCLKLPPKMYHRILCRFSEEQTTLYQAVKARFLDDLDSYEPSDLSTAIFRLFSGLHSVSCGVLPSGFLGARRLRNQRMDALFAELRQLKTSHVIIWVNYLESIAALDEAFPKVFPKMPVYTVHGRVPVTARTTKIDLWKRRGGVLMATQGTGGYGLTLTESHRVFFYSENWRYALRLQAEDRCHRIGQKSSVYYTTLQGESRFDERIRSALTRKADALEELKKEVRRLNGNRNAIRKLMEQAV